MFFYFQGYSLEVIKKAHYVLMPRLSKLPTVPDEETLPSLSPS